MTERLDVPQFGYEWMSALARMLPGTGAAYLLLGEVPRMTTVPSVTVLLVWAAGALLLGGCDRCVTTRPGSAGTRTVAAPGRCARADYPT